jgi:hypothetical protein
MLYLKEFFKNNSKQNKILVKKTLLLNQQGKAWISRRQFRKVLSCVEIYLLQLRGHFPLLSKKVWNNIALISYKQYLITPVSESYGSSQLNNFFLISKLKNPTQII